MVLEVLLHRTHPYNPITGFNPAKLGYISSTSVLAQPSQHVDRCARIFNRPKKLIILGETKQIRRVVTRFWFQKGANMSMSYVTSLEPATTKAAKEMSLDDFVRNAGSDEVKRLFHRVQGGTFSGCHTAFFEATGIWIPELVPVFKKLDAMMVLRDQEIRPQGIKKP